TQRQEDWLGPHVRAFAYFGGCPENLVPDNTKTGVSEASAASSTRCRRSLLSSANGSPRGSISTITSLSMVTSIRCRTGWCSNGSTSFVTATAVAVFHRGERVASHSRGAAKGHHTTLPKHMPPGDRQAHAGPAARRDCRC